MRAFFAEGQFTTEDDETLTLVCDFSTIDVVEGVTEQSWDEVLPQVFPTFRPGEEPAPGSRALAVKLLYGLLRKRHESITLNEAAAVSYDRNSIVLWATVGDVIRRACNIDDGEEAKDENPPKRRGRSKASEKNG